MDKYDKIIFICNGNTSRSPMAETIYRSLETNQELAVTSRGLVVLFPEPPNPKAVIVMNNHNLSVEEHTASQLTEEDFDEHTILLTMSEKQKNKVLDEFGEMENVSTLKEFIGEAGDVTEPFGGSLIEYENCYVELATLIKKLVYKLNQEEL